MCYKQHPPSTPPSFTASSSLLRIQCVENVHFLQIFRSGKTVDKKEQDQQDVFEDAEDGDAEDGDEEEGEEQFEEEEEEEVVEDQGLEEQSFSETPVSGQNGTEVSA